MLLANLKGTKRPVARGATRQILLAHPQKRHDRLLVLAPLLPCDALMNNMPVITRTTERMWLVALASVFFSLGFGGGNYVARVPALRDHLGLREDHLGWFLLVGGIGAVTAFRTGGPLVRRFDARALAVWGSITASVLLFIPAYTHVVLVAAVANFIGGYGNGMVDVSINANGVQLERRLSRPVLGRLHGICSLGSFCGAATGTMAAFYALSLLHHFIAVGVVVTLWSLCAWPYLMPDAAHVPVRRRTRERLPPLLRWLGAIAFCSSVGEGAMSQWTAIFLRDELKTGEAMAAFGYAVFAAAMVAGRFFGDSLARRVAPEKILFGSGLLAATSLAAALILDTAHAVTACGAGVGLGLAMVIPVVFRLAAAHSPAEPSAAIASVATVSYGGFLFGPPSIGLIAHHANLRTALWLVVVLLACLALVSRVLARIVARAAHAPPVTAP